MYGCAVKEVCWLEGKHMEKDGIPCPSTMVDRWAEGGRRYVKEGGNA